MIGVTHTGKIGDLSFCLPICSWLHKTYGEKIIFIFPNNFPFIKAVESLLRIQNFTEDVIYCDFPVAHWDLGGQPYHFNPHDYVPDLKISRYYNFGFRGVPDKYVPYFYAEEHNLGVDLDFVLNLDIEFRHHSDKLMCTEVMHKYLPFYEPTDLNKDFLAALQDFAYAKERHMHFSSLAAYLGMARIPFYLYFIARKQPQVDSLSFNDVNIIDPKDYWIYYKNMPILDFRTLNESNQLISNYDQVLFK